MKLLSSQALLSEHYHVLRCTFWAKRIERTISGSNLPIRSKKRIPWPIKIRRLYLTLNWACPSWTNDVQLNHTIFQRSQIFFLKLMGQSSVIEAYWTDFIFSKASVKRFREVNKYSSNMWLLFLLSWNYRSLHIRALFFGMRMGYGVIINILEHERLNSSLTLLYGYYCFEGLYI